MKLQLSQQEGQIHKLKDLCLITCRNWKVYECSFNESYRKLSPLIIKVEVDPDLVFGWRWGDTKLYKGRGGSRFSFWLGVGRYELWPHLH